MSDHGIAGGNPGDTANGTVRNNNGDAPSQGTERQAMCDGGTDPEAWSPEAADEPPTYGSVKGMSDQQWVQAVYAGFRTRAALADAMNVGATSTVGRNLDPLCDDPDAPVTKRQDGRKDVYVYTGPDPQQQTQGGSGQQAQGSSNGQGGNGDATDHGADQVAALLTDFPKAPGEYPSAMPDYRHTIDYDEHVPTGVPEYYPSGTEMEDLEMYAHQVEQMDPVDPTDPSVGDMAGKEPLAVQMVGPTGCGKTHAAKALAGDKDWAYVEVTMDDDMDPSDLKGYPNFLGDFAVWADGELVEPCMLSQEGNTILVLDEVNRNPRVVSVLMSLLDSRGTITLDSRSGEEVVLCKENTVVVTTRNPADDADYEVADLGRAQKNRLGRYNRLDYLGENHPGREAELLATREGVDQGWARNLVDAANEVREAADAAGEGGGDAFGAGGGGGGDGDGPDMADVVSTAIPTRTLLMMARDGRMAAESGHPSPSRRAVTGYLHNDYEGEALDLVRTVLTDAVEGDDPTGGA